MSSIRVKRYQWNSIQFCEIVDECDCPADPYASAYLSEHIAAKSANTCFRHANELLFLLKYFNKQNIDLVHRVGSGRFLTEREYFQYYEHCFFQQSAFKDDSVVLFPTITDKQLRNVISANQRGLAKVSSETIQGRVRRLRQYLEFLFGHFHDQQSAAEGVSDRFDRLIAKIKLDEQGFASNAPQTVANPATSVIPNDVFARLLEMTLPSSPNNPYTTSALRNYLIVSLLIQTGIRRGALAKLKISDFHFYGSYDRVSIYRSGNDRTDTRLEKPNQKTKSHLATVDPALMRQIKYYIDHVRSKFPQLPHEFVFVSEKDSNGTIGQPLSLKAINGIFVRLSKKLRFHVHPHLLRHKWNEIFDKSGEAKGIDRKLLEDIRKYAMGWVANSEMGQRYNEKRLAEKAREVSQAHQARVDQA